MTVLIWLTSDAEPTSKVFPDLKDRQKLPAINPLAAAVF